MTIEDLNMLCWQQTTAYTHESVSYVLAYKIMDRYVELLDMYNLMETTICTIPHGIFSTLGTKDILVLINSYMALNKVQKPGVGKKIKKISGGK